MAAETFADGVGALQQGVLCALWRLLDSIGWTCRSRGSFTISRSVPASYRPQSWCRSPGAAGSTRGAFRAAGADEFIERLPRGLDTKLDENGANLSGGQKQRLAIARALVRQPPILVLDEATSALDPESEALLQDNLMRIAEGRTLIMISHRLSMLKPADNILVLDAGRVVGFGPHDGLLNASCGNAANDLV